MAALKRAFSNGMFFGVTEDDNWEDEEENKHNQESDASYCDQIRSRVFLSIIEDMMQ